MICWLEGDGHSSSHPRWNCGRLDVSEHIIDAVPIAVDSLRCVGTSWCKGQKGNVLYFKSRRRLGHSDFLAIAEAVFECFDGFDTLLRRFSFQFENAPFEVKVVITDK